MHPPEKPTVAQFAAADAALDSLQAQVMREVNRVRLKSGVPLLRIDPAVQRAAVIFSAELAAREGIAHSSVTPTRRNVAERLRSEGTIFVAAGENLARLDDPIEKVARHVVEMWWDSPPHHRTMLDPHFDRAAVGVTRSPDGNWYIVQMFAATKYPMLTRH